MFGSSRTSPFARRARAALSLARSFLLDDLGSDNDLRSVEDDYDVDWEVDGDEHSRGEQRRAYLDAAADASRMRRRPSPERSGTSREPSAATHPHRVPLRRNAVVRAGRRAGQPTPGQHVCLCSPSHQHPRPGRSPVVTVLK
jgi:hypothetical protein